MSTEELQARVADNPAWYHTLEVAPGVVTDGYVDWRAKAAAILPDDLSGKRCLDVGTYDGFWAFEMERRGGEVVAIDVDELNAADWPPVNRAKLERRSRTGGWSWARASGSRTSCAAPTSSA